MFMKFTPKFNTGVVATGVLAVAGLGWVSSSSRVKPAPAPLVRIGDALAVQDSFQSYGHASVLPSVGLIPAVDLQRATPEKNYIPVSAWYKNKHWWKRNAPIVGGAGGGALVGGLLGGGKGAVIGGAVGGGGGYLYKRSRRHHEYYYRHH
jgi:hypothetical protein